MDIGANKGQFLKSVFGRGINTCFDKIDSFEPFPPLALLAQKRFPQACVHSFGLWNASCSADLHGAGGIGGSIWADKTTNVEDLNLVTCRFMRATEWFEKNISSTDLVIAKMNCEGAECDIIDDLILSGEFSKIRQILVSFDIDKIPSQQHRKLSTLLLLRSSGYIDRVVAFVNDPDEDFPDMKYMTPRQCKIYSPILHHAMTRCWYENFLKQILEA